MTDVARQTYGLERGALDLQSIGPITFGPESILFIADSAGATRGLPHILAARATTSTSVTLPSVPPRTRRTCRLCAAAAARRCRSF
jgi:hypothetical protein